MKVPEHRIALDDIVMDSVEALGAGLSGDMRGMLGELIRTSGLYKYGVNIDDLPMVVDAARTLDARGVGSDAAKETLTRIFMMERDAALGGASDDPLTSYLPAALNANPWLASDIITYLSAESEPVGAQQVLDFSDQFGTRSPEDIAEGLHLVRSYGRFIGHGLEALERAMNLDERDLEYVEMLDRHRISGLGPERIGAMRASYPLLLQAVEASIKAVKPDVLARTLKEPRSLMREEHFASLEREVSGERVRDVLIQALASDSYRATLESRLDGRLEEHRERFDPFGALLDPEAMRSGLGTRWYRVVGESAGEIDTATYGRDGFETIEEVIKGSVVRSPRSFVRSIAGSIGIPEGPLERQLETIEHTMEHDALALDKALLAAQAYLSTAHKVRDTEAAQSLRDRAARVREYGEGSVFGLRVSEKDPIADLKLGNLGGSCLGFSTDTSDFGAPKMVDHFASRSSQFIEVLYHKDTIGFYLVEAMDRGGDAVLVSNGQYLSKHIGREEVSPAAIDAAADAYMAEWAKQVGFVGALTKDERRDAPAYICEEFEPIGIRGYSDVSSVDFEEDQLYLVADLGLSNAS